MLLRQIRYFVAIVDCNSFTEAAARCYISQSAISQQIKALERDLGVCLIRRENRKFSLTPAGEYFYRHGKALLYEAEEICRETARVGREQQRHLRIGYLRGYSGQELYQAVAEFSRKHPEVAIHIVNGTHEELYDLLRFYRVDWILSDQRRAFSEEYVNISLKQCVCCAELSVHHPWSGQDTVQLEALRQFPCILISPKEQQSTEQEYYQNTLGFGETFLFAENLEEARMMVASNRGFLPIETLGTLPESRLICRIPIFRGAHPLLRNYCVFWEKGQNNEDVLEFTELLEGMFCKEF